LRFHIVSPIGVLLNIPLIPLTSLALLLGGLGLCLSAIWGPLGFHAARAAGWLLEATQAIVFWGVARPGGRVFVARPSGEWVLVFYGLLGLAAVGTVSSARTTRTTPSRKGNGGLWWLLAAWTVPGWFLIGIWDRLTAPEAEVLAVGHGLSVLV